jgi:hypothetical protein
LVGSKTFEAKRSEKKVISFRFEAKQKMEGNEKLLKAKQSRKCCFNFSMVTSEKL